MTNQGTPIPFHERFNIPLGDAEAHRRFVNRITTLLLDRYQEPLQVAGVESGKFHTDLAYALGAEKPRHPKSFVGSDFHRCLEVLELMYQVLRDEDVRVLWAVAICKAINDSEVDLGISWRPPIFVRTGARLLDESLVNEPLRWLSEPKYGSVRKPFEKGLSHYLEATSKPDRLADVVTDLYEAIEALAKIATGRDKDLSGNRELFIKNLRVSDYYKQLLKDYITYANQYRHAAQQNKSRPPLSEPEVESFVYLTGLFIRLAVQQT